MINKEDRGYGVIVVLRKENDKDRFLIIHQNSGYWGLPKGHAEKGENNIEAAIRELKEEVGVTEIQLTKFPGIKDYYFVEINKQKYDKTVEFFIAFTNNDKVVIQESEIQNYKWATYEEALGILTYNSTKNVIKTTQKYLKDMVK